jgi:hypothetical protein
MFLVKTIRNRWTGFMWVCLSVGRCSSGRHLPHVDDVEA